MGTERWSVATVELDKELPDLGFGENLVRPDGPMAGHDDQAFVQGLFEQP